MKERLKGKGKALLLLPGSLFLALASVLPANAQWSKGKSMAGESELESTAVSDIIKALMNWLLYILGAISIIGFVVSGILYLTSAGDEDRIERAKRGMIYSVIGVIVGLVGLVVVTAVEAWFGDGSDF
jgi:hypothetical protein